MPLSSWGKQTAEGRLSKQITCLPRLAYMHLPHDTASYHVLVGDTRPQMRLNIWYACDSICD